jgi:hypothetical protein
MSFNLQETSFSEGSLSPALSSPNKEGIMEAKHYNVVFRGEIAQGKNIQQIKSNLSTMFKLNALRPFLQGSR